MKTIVAPLDKGQIKKLKAGDEVLLSGEIYTARDQAHKRFIEAISKRKKLPFDFKNQIIYYCGPNPGKKGRPIGSCGPTTSSRVDKFTPALIKAGIRGMIGKGARAKEIVTAVKKYKAVYLLAPAGLGALISKFVKKAKVVCYKDLGPEAVYKFKVSKLPLIVAIDAKGNNIFTVHSNR
ncbi:MAG: Fe-S-containing hydro-lyase [Candidatus Omnitrophota bacterium]|nr:MAG: Fe-S-containing hydro-lyase [Candidatus Omnitrophota bacterium]